MLTYACMHAIYARTAPFAAHGRDRRCEGTGGVKASPSQSCMHGQHERLHRQWERGWRPHFSCGCHPHPHRQPITPTTHPHLRPHPSASSVQRSAFSVQRQRSASASASTSTCSPRAQLSAHVRRQRRALARLQYMYGPVYACMHVCAHVHMHVMHEKTSTGTAPVVAGLGPGPEVWGSSKGRGAASGRKGEQSAMLLITYHVSRIARHVSLITYLVSHVTHHSSLITYHPHHSPSSGRASGAQRCPPWGSID